MLAALSVVACSPSAPPRGPLDPDPAGPLACQVTPCRSLADERAAQCSQPGTQVRIGAVGGFTVLIAETDPTSVVFTSFKLYFDASGRLVGRSSFVNEWGRATKEGFVPPDAPTNLAPACSP